MKPYTETIPDSDVKFEMVPIRGGVFTMGGPGPDESPKHQVKVGAFWMGKTEVTWDEYDIFRYREKLLRRLAASPAPSGAADAVTRPTPPYADETFGYAREGNPVISITHHAAMEYCAWLSAKTGKTYRLPTEAEWEYAARAGTETAYSFGDDPAPLGEYAWYKDNSGQKPHPVGKKKPNAWGLYDIYGNVAEWILDRYSPTFYHMSQSKLPVLSPVLLPGDEEYPHVARGGSWDDPAPRLRSAARLASESMWNRRDPQEPQSIWWLTEAVTVGFRVVRPVEEQANLKGFRSKTKPGQGTAPDVK